MEDAMSSQRHLAKINAPVVVANHFEMCESLGNPYGPNAAPR